MMDNMQAFQIWAPDGALWTDWAKPVLFASARPSKAPLGDVALDWLEGAPPRAMLIVDLPGKKGVEAGVALARRGHRPVPLYNGVMGPPGVCVIDAGEIAGALFQGAEALAGLSIRSDAPPAFLLDANRMNGVEKQPGKFDNRWCVFPQDMPSAAFVLAQGVGDVLLRSDCVRMDLSHILRRYQESGIRIWRCSNQQTKRVDISRPSRFRSALYRFSAMMGLTRNAAGGFGGMIPEPTQGGSGSRYHGFG